MTLDEVKHLVEEVLEIGPGTDPNFFQAAVILLSCASVGPNADRITKFTVREKPIENSWYKTSRKEVFT